MMEAILVRSEALGVTFCGANEAESAESMDSVF